MTTDEEARRRERTWLMWQVEDLLQRAAEDIVVEDIAAAMPAVDALITRGEAIAALRAQKGKTLAPASRQALQDIHDQLSQLRHVLAGSTPC